MTTFLYLRGEPGSGKITVARILEKELGWTLFWLHDLDAICKIVGDHRIPRLMDEITIPIIRYLLKSKKNIIYVRPSRDSETVHLIQDLVNKDTDYNFKLIYLNATYETLCKRVSSRMENNYRIHTKDALDEYRGSRPKIHLPEEEIIRTDYISPEAVAAIIKSYLGLFNYASY